GYQNLDVGNVRSRNVTGLARNTNDYYRLRAYNGNGTSPNSTVIRVKTSPDGSSPFPPVLGRQGQETTDVRENQTSRLLFAPGHRGNRVAPWPRTIRQSSVVTCGFGVA